MNQTLSCGMRRRGFVRCGALLLLWPPCAAPAQPPATTLPLSQAINRAGKMRALSQRLSKAYVQGSLGVLPERARDILAASRQLMSSILAELGAAPLAPETRRLLQALEKDCQGLLENVALPRKDVLEVARSADVVLESADRLTKAFEAQSIGGNARIVNVAGRQRMLAQRAARAYFLSAAGHDTQAVRAQLAGARSEIAQGLAGLQAAPISTPAIRNELELARSQWLFYEAALAKAASPDALQTVATTSERVYEVMDNLTSLYDSALRDLLG
ncbi:MAG TPA: type IV pili methyl-accepting chemotaxis transducer N-terminal domain-containing protein [Ramlibacter sp.]|nr:type IV pili methyl-accepting chemotaxis transducer N-terminal domain-containing protein [Ramlibacter sp.]